VRSERFDRLLRELRDWCTEGKKNPNVMNCWWKLLKSLEFQSIKFQSIEFQSRKCKETPSNHERRKDSV
jgi:hypothetical protein